MERVASSLKKGFMTLLVSLIFLISPNSPAYAGWTSISIVLPDMDGWWLNGVHFPSSNEGWAVGIDHVDPCGLGKPPSPPKGVLLKFSSSSVPLIGDLENPSNGQKVSGIRAIYGWALDGAGITRVELFIDDQFYIREFFSDKFYGIIGGGVIYHDDFITGNWHGVCACPQYAR